MSFRYQVKMLGFEIRRYPRTTLFLGKDVIFRTTHIRAAIRHYSAHVGGESKTSTRGFHEALSEYIKELEARIEMCRNHLEIAARLDVARGGTFAKKLVDEGIIE